MNLITTDKSSICACDRNSDASSEQLSGTENETKTDRIRPKNFSDSA
ncbi:MAG: hypothetical protein LBH80_02925 [Prevotellaceae bacterium]|nr:hypothetical protein [Prevotellaceae bacterium]